MPINETRTEIQIDSQTIKQSQLLAKYLSQVTRLFSFTV